MGIFSKTAEFISSILPQKARKISRDELEEILVGIDLEYPLVELVLSRVGTEISKNELAVALDSIVRGDSFYDEIKANEITAKPCIDLIVGVNGAGKTTTIAKLARLYQKNGKSVILGAGDTFRAAAIEQLKLWGERLGVSVISSQMGHDPSAVAFDTISAAIARGVDAAIIDTAGRLHNKQNLQNELQKIARICDKALSGAPHRKILVLDGTQGSSALAQAEIFAQTLSEVCATNSSDKNNTNAAQNTKSGLSGVIISKLDGTSKGGAVFSVVSRLRVPILFVGTGEGADDLVEFKMREFIDGILDSIFKE